MEFKIALISGGFLFAYLITAMSCVFIFTKQWLNLVMEYPMACVLISRIWYYGSMLTLIGTVAYHFIVKYW